MFFSLILKLKSYNKNMKRKLNLKNLFLIFSIILSVFFLLAEQLHECEGDGCLICLFSTIIRFASNILLLTTFASIVVKKTYTLIKNVHANIINQINFNNNETVFTCNPINNKEVKLTSFCIALK